MLTNSLKRKNPAKANRQAVASLKSDRVLLSRASLTISASNAGVTGSFFTVGLAKILRIPSNVVLKKGDTVGDGRPAVACTQANAMQASSTAALDCRLFPKC